MSAQASADRIERSASKMSANARGLLQRPRSCFPLLPWQAKLYHPGQPRAEREGLAASDLSETADSELKQFGFSREWCAARGRPGR